MKNVKLDLSGLNATGLAAKSQNLEDSMTGNVNFPTPTPAIADITAKRVELEDWIVKSEFGDRRAIASRKATYAALYAMIKQLAGYVTSVAAGSETVILSSGFEVTRRPEPTPPLGRPVDLRVNRTSHPGQAEITWKAVRGSRNYVVEMTTDDPAVAGANWSIVGYSTRSRFMVDALTLGTYYYFRVKAFGVHDNSAFSDVGLVLAA